MHLFVRRTRHLGLVLSLFSTLGCQAFLLKTGVNTAEPYFTREDTRGTQLEKLTDRVYTFHWNWYRNLIVVTRDGLVVIDPMGGEAAAALHAELERVFPEKKVVALISGLTIGI